MSHTGPRFGVLLCVNTPSVGPVDSSGCELLAESDIVDSEQFDWCPLLLLVVPRCYIRTTDYLCLVMVD